MRHLQQLHHQVHYRQLGQRVWLWTGNAANVARVRQVARETVAKSAVFFGKPIKDVGASTVDGKVDCSDQVSATDAAQFAFLGPSRKCANSRLLESHRAGKWRRAPFFYLVWVIDQPRHLEEFVLLNVDLVWVISNTPLRMQASLEAMRARECT
jgi:hypothetical protein